MSARWQIANLGDHVEILSGFAFDSEAFGDVGELPIARIRDVVRGHSETYYQGSFDPQFVINNGDLLVGMDGEFNRARWQGGRALLNQRVCRIRPTNGHLHEGFLFHFLPQALKAIEDATPLVTVKHLSTKSIRTIQVPLPPLAEQRRIAEVLDRAEALRAKRRAALAQLDSLTQSLFLDLFGDPTSNSRDWPHLRLGDVISIPLRNGLSPSKAGRVIARVLTLSAITGSSFDARACKESTFISKPPEDQSVNVSDFLVCRGNGNVRLVGKGFFPPASMPDITFPDTMIAARIAPEKIERAFLQHIWNSPAVRAQIESSARTTNGTFKVNQEILEKIQFVGPPLPLQQTFARRVAAVERLKASHRTALAHLDALFASLQHRAFRGEL